MPSLPRLKAIAARLEIAVLAIALLALAFRATLYWTLPGGGNGGSGPGALLDFGLALLLFLLCALCASAGVAISVLGERSDKRHAYQAFFIGVLSFLAYDLLYPHVPQLL